jgi:hypothetical protein
MTQTLKIVMNKIVFNKNGDSPGKSETYWNLMVDDQVINSRSRDEARKTGDGDIVVIGDSGTVTKADNASLTVLGDVADVDGFLKGGDDKGSFKHVYTKANNFGIGSHIAQVSDPKGHLSAAVYYTIAAA